MPNNQYIKMNAALQHVLKTVKENPIKSSYEEVVVDQVYSGRPYLANSIILTKHCIPSTDEISKEDIVKAIKWILQSQGFTKKLKDREIRFTDDVSYNNEYPYRNKTIKILDNVSKQKNAVVVICRTAHNLQVALFSKEKLNGDINSLLKFHDQNSDAEEEVDEEGSELNSSEGVSNFNLSNKYNNQDCNMWPNLGSNDFCQDSDTELGSEFVVDNHNNDDFNENFVDEKGNLLEKNPFEQLSEDESDTPSTEDRYSLNGLSHSDTEPEPVVENNNNHKNFLDENVDAFEKNPLQQLKDERDEIYQEYRNLLIENRWLKQKVIKLELGHVEENLKKSEKEKENSIKSLQGLERFGVFYNSKNPKQDNNNDSRGNYAKKN